MSPNELADLVRRSAPFVERLEGRGLPRQQAPGEVHLVSDRLCRWKEAAELKSEEAFATRLRWAGLVEAELPQLLADESLASAPAPLPRWARLLGDVIAFAGCEVDPDYRLGPALDARRATPFEHFYLPHLRVADRWLKESTEHWTNAVDEPVRSQLRRRLLNRLADLGNRCLDFRFALFRREATSGLQALFGNAEGDDLYRDFISQIGRRHLNRFYVDYPVLGRLSGTAIEQWIDAQTEFLSDLVQDREELEDVFSAGAALGRVAKILPMSSDAHNNGRTVIGIEFATGIRLVYKPKNLSIDAVYCRLLAWMNERGFAPPLNAPRLIAKERHGWMEYFEHTPCPNVEAARRYFRRSGALLCAFHALQGSDCHHENLIAHAEYPVLVDLETAMTPSRAAGTADNDAVMAAQSLVEQSVLRTGFLPTWDIAPGGHIFDSSSLGGAVNQDSLYRAPSWQNINSDAMCLSYEHVVTENPANCVLLQGKPLDPTLFIEDIVAGFRDAYGLLLEHRAELGSAKGPLADAARCQVRFVFRATSLYAILREKLLHPKHLRSGIDRGIEMEVLARTLLSGDSPASCYPLLLDEYRQLECSDIPFFSASSDSTQVRLSTGQVVDGCLADSARDRMKSMVDSLGLEDLARQESFLRASFELRSLTHASGELGSTGQSIDEAPHLEAEELCREALQLARTIVKAAIVGRDGSLTWIGPVYEESSQRFHVQPISFDLYDGLSGVALFLAALARVAGSNEFRDMALSAFRPVCFTLERKTASKQLADLVGIGGLTGIPSIVYGLLAAGRLLDEPSLLDSAVQASHLVSEEAIAADTNFDLVSGAAGAILSLAALYEERPSPLLLSRIEACGRHLLRSRSDTSNGQCTWRHGATGRALTGFSHGAGGIAYALAELFRLTGDTDYRRAALGALAFEDAHFDAKAGNWADLRGRAIYGDDQPRYVCTWCYGAPGIVLSRLGVLAAFEDSVVRRALDDALARTVNFDFLGEDHLCCGTMGRLETFLAAGRSLGHSSWIELAWKRAAVVVQRARARGGFVMPQAFFSPSLFVGVAGVGYQLLRLARAEVVPPILRLALMDRKILNNTVVSAIH